MELVVKSDNLRIEKQKNKIVMKRDIFRRRTFRSVSNSKNNSLTLTKNDSLSPERHLNGVIL